MKPIGTLVDELANRKPLVGLNLGLIEFYECPDPDYEYRIDEITSPSRLLWLVSHIGRKRWATRDTLRELVEIVSDHHRFDLPHFAL